MEAEVVRLSGTPQEVAEVLARIRTGGIAVESSSVDSVLRPEGALPRSVLAWMDEWDLPKGWRPAITTLLEEAQSWEGVQLRITKGRNGQTDSAGRVRLVYGDNRQGFAFLGRRGKLFLALPDVVDLGEFDGAKWRHLEGPQPTQFNAYMYVRTEDAVDPALGLLRVAYKFAQPET